MAGEGGETWMSHFSTVVILPKDYTGELETMVEEMLEPFDENTEVEEYDRECYCKGQVALKAGWEEAEKKLGRIDELRTTYWNLDADKRPAWEDWISPLVKV